MVLRYLVDLAKNKTISWITIKPERILEPVAETFLVGGMSLTMMVRHPCALLLWHVPTIGMLWCLTVALILLTSISRLLLLLPGIDRAFPAKSFL